MALTLNVAPTRIPITTACFRPQKHSRNYRNIISKPQCKRARRETNHGLHVTKECFLAVERFLKEFSNLSSDLPCDTTNMWTTISLYFFLLHIPLGLGGLSIVSKLLHQDNLSSETMAISLVFTQALEFVGTILLIKSTYKSMEPFNMFKLQEANIWKGRGWIKGSLFGISIIYVVAFLTTVIFKIFRAKDTKSVILRELFSSTNIARTSSFLVYGFITPMSEEYVFRGFLLTLLISCMEWPLAVLVSSCLFSVAHFSTESFIQLLFIGGVLGCVYVWTGNLVSPLLIHTLYNISILMTVVLD